MSDKLQADWYQAHNLRIEAWNELYGRGGSIDVAGWAALAEKLDQLIDDLTGLHWEG